MDELTSRLVETVREQIEKSASSRGEVSVDCCSTCRSASQATFWGKRQPPEVWEPLLRSIANYLLWTPFVQMERSIRACESPLEELMFIALVHEAKYYHDAMHFDGSDCVPFEAPSSVAIRPQVVFGDYRVDFLVSSALRIPEQLDEEGNGVERWHQASVIVEVDGHDFHEKTKEQASRDKKRDRRLQAAGLSVFRFTGRDVWSGPLDSAREALDAAWELAQKAAPIQSRPIIAKTRSR